jgi:transposase InsO family protein
LYRGLRVPPGHLRLCPRVSPYARYVTYDRFPLLRTPQYTSIRYTERLGDISAVRSVGRKGDSYDNAAAEALNSLYKKELIDREGPWRGVDDVMLATLEWVSWYNTERLHSACGYMPPKEYEENYYARQEGVVS